MTKPLYPPGATNANWFQLFNAVAFQIVLGSPMILYAKSLGATATTLGVIASLTPLLTITQIPAARFLINTGYRDFLFRGWGSRTLFVFVIAAIPLCAFLNDIGKMALLLFCQFGFNLLRGITSGAWLPWMTDLIPEEMRGRFLSRDQFLQNIGSFFALLLSAMLLRPRGDGVGGSGGAVMPWQFAALFFVSALGGAVSLIFLLRVPDVVARETLVKSTARVPWREIVTFPPFFRLVIFTLLWVFAVGAVGVFSVAFLKTEIGYSESTILFLTTLYFGGALVSLPLVGRLLDRTGSKAVLQSMFVILLAYYLIWWLVSARAFVKPSLLLFSTLFFFNGIAAACFNVAHVRLVMNTMPQMGRSHFFAFFTVISSLGLGFSPIIWGLVIDAIGARDFHFAHFAAALSWNRFSVFFFSVLVLLVVVLSYSFLLHEQRQHGARVDPRGVIFRGNLRRVLRLWQR